MTVLLKPGVPRPGELLEVEARLEAKTETPLDGVSFDLTGVETVTVQQGRSNRRWSHPHVVLRAEHPGTLLTPGMHSYRARFQLPPVLPPRYLGRYTRIDYTLKVRASIPWWPDRVGVYEVPVVPPVVEPSPVGGLFVSEYGGASAGELYAELSLAATTLEPGGEVVGNVAFTNVARGRVRGVRVSLVAFERLFASGSFFQGGSIATSKEVLRWSYVLGAGPLEEGKGVPFRFGIARDTVPSFTGSISALDWAVEITAERAWSSVPLLRAPVVIVPATGQAPRPRGAATPAVGRERRAQSWQQVGERLGLPYVAEHDELRGVAGSVGIRMAVETRADGTLATVARLGWPALGMGFGLSPGSWTDRLASREIDVGLDHFDRRFHLRGRAPEQVRALLDEALCAQLMAFEDVLADDDGASFTVAKALVDIKPLTELVSRVIGAARAFDEAFARIPLPGPLAEQAAAWRDFAGRLGGRFEPGRGAVHDGAFGQERVEIVTQWSDDGSFESTLVRMPLGAQIDVATVAPSVRALATSLEQRAGGRATLAAESFALVIDRLVPDPAELESVLEDMTRIVQGLRGRGAAGPFR